LIVAHKQSPFMLETVMDFKIDSPKRERRHAL
jgi:hypothetical protein